MLLMAWLATLPFRTGIGGRGRMLRCLGAAVAVMLLGCSPTARAGPRAMDASGVAVELPAPARRVVTLAPHAAELLAAAGALDALVGVVAHSDFPPAAANLPRVGDAAAVDLEAVVGLDPDLVVGWHGGNPPGLLERIHGLGIPLYRSGPVRLEDIAAEIRALGVLTGHAGTAEAAAAGFLSRLRELRRRYRRSHPVPVFYQVWDRPLVTVGGRHFITQGLAACGARNVFAELSAPAPQVAEEEVLLRRPRWIVAGAPIALRELWRGRWIELGLESGHILFVDPDRMHRPVPRMLDELSRLCPRLGDTGG